jgi:hypothetical protein
MICPACITTVALAIAGVTSTGGVTGLVVTKLHGKKKALRETKEKIHTGPERKSS